MTVVKILSSNEVEQPEKKKIEFVKGLFSDGTFTDIPLQPHRMDYVILLRKKLKSEDFDTMYAYTGDQILNGMIYLGHFNDGIV